MKIRKQQIILCILYLIPSLQAQCGYESCPETEDDKLNVHIVAHSHDDVGWLKTVDQYFQGSNRQGWVGWEENQRAGVQYIIDTVVEELAMDPNKKFIQVEIAFFWRWWREQDEITKELVVDLVNEGQLQFTGGGWSMNDEGASHYAAIIDNMGLGLRKLNDTFGQCAVPKVAWQIDPFGHSKEQANMFAKMGFDGLFFARLDWRDKETRMKNLEMEMVWEPSQDSGDSSDLFTGVLYDHYGPPAGFCWDLICNDVPMMDSSHVDNNIDNRTQEFISYVRRQASFYNTNNIMLTMGMDFNYQAAHAWFMNLDKLISYVPQADNSINIFYSTPACYLNALHNEGISWPTKQDDFFPYASDPHAYWSGYFSSRPTSKFMIRQTEKTFKTLSQMMVLADLDYEGINILEETVGVVQHHDAVTGTEKQHVADNYHLRMHRAMEEAANSINLTSVSFDDFEADLVICPLLNITQCSATVGFNEQLTVNIYNPLAHQRSYYARIPVILDTYQVIDVDGTEMISQLVPIPAGMMTIPGRQSDATHELVWRVSLTPMSVTTYHVTRANSGADMTRDISKNKQSHSKLSTLGKRKKKTLVNNKHKITVEHGRSEIFFHDMDLSVNLDMMYYKGHRGNNSEFEFRASGAYIFRPDGDEISFGDPVNTQVVEGPVLDEVIWTYSEPWVTKTLRTYKDDGHMEIQWVVGPIPVDDGIGKEVIVRVCTEGISNNGNFYTDSNGRQVVERVLNQRPTFEINMTEPVAQNYYPINSKILIKNQDYQLGLLTDRSQSGTSLQDGCVEAMVHRRLLDDDAFGVGEALNEKAYGKGLVAVGKHVLLVDEEEQSFNEQHRIKAIELFHEPMLIFGDLQQGSNFPFIPKLTEALPKNIHILTLRKMPRNYDPFGKYLFLQLEHIFQKNEHDSLSQQVTVVLENLFESTSIAIENYRETTLGGNVWLDQLDRISFNKESNEIPNWSSGNSDSKQWAITLNPMDIRSFIIKYN